LNGAVKGENDMQEVHYGGEGPHWTVMPKKNKKKTIKSGRLKWHVARLEEFMGVFKMLTG
jgi:hypothetical protein